MKQAPCMNSSTEDKSMRSLSIDIFNKFNLDSDNIYWCLKEDILRKLRYAGMQEQYNQTNIIALIS